MVQDLRPVFIDLCRRDRIADVFSMIDEYNETMAEHLSFLCEYFGPNMIAHTEYTPHMISSAMANLCETGSYDIAKMCIEYRDNMGNPFPRTTLIKCLERCIDHHNFALARYLMARGISFTAFSRLLFSIKRDDIVCTEWIIDNMSGMSDGDLAECIRRAMTSSNVSIYRMLDERGLIQNHGELFVVACERGYIEFVLWLKDLVDDNSLSRGFEESCKRGYLEIVLNLRDNNVNIHRGMWNACARGHIKVIACLSTIAEDRTICNMMYWAVFGGSRDCVAFLWVHGFPITRRDFSAACASGSLEMCEHLFQLDNSCICREHLQEANDCPMIREWILRVLPV